MARFRLKTAHVIKHSIYGSEVLLYGDKEFWDQGLASESEFRGVVVGDGTPYHVDSATMFMEPLDDEARVMIDNEIDRIAKNEAAVAPLEALARTFGVPLNQDNFERNYVPGFPGVPRPEKSDA